jgi:trehalose-phosphatase
MKAEKIKTEPAHAERRLSEFFTRLRTAADRLLLLDYDGTLAPFNIDRAKAYPYPGIRERLDAIMAEQRNQVIIISGRWTRDLLPLLGLHKQPQLWGSHGWEHLEPGGEYVVDRFDDAALQVLAEVDEWAEQIELRGGRCEHKPGCLAIHWRGLPAKQQQHLYRYIQERWEQQPPHPGLAWHDFDGGMELRVLGRGKGSVIERILLDSPPQAVKAYLGDDRTDEDAFRALNGHGLTVLVRSEPRSTAAEVWLRPPEELIAFLDRWLEG